MIQKPVGNGRPLRIGIYTNVLAHKPSGIGWHVIHLLDALSKVDPTNSYFLIHRMSGESSESSFYQPASPNFKTVPVFVPKIFYEKYFRVYDSWLLPRKIRRLRLDVFHGPNHYLPRRGKTPQVVTFHDVAESVTDSGPVGDVQRAAVRRCLSRADGVIALSQCTLSDLQRIANPPEVKHVIYQGGNFSPDRTRNPEILTAVRKRFGLAGRYLLFVGTILPRKNVPVLVRAFASLAPSFESDLKLVLAGADGSDEAARVRRACDEVGVRDRVVFTGYLPTEHLASLYDGATVFVLPSKYEGFGMILVEAMAAGVPIVCTAAGALPEVLGDAGLLVTEGDAEALAGAVTRVLASPLLAADLAARGRVRQADFSWQTTAEQTLAVYRAAAAAGRPNTHSH